MTDGSGGEGIDRSDGAEAGTDSGTPGAEPGGDGPVDYDWVMQVTFVVTILLGAPLIAGLSVFFQLPTWESRVGFAARIGALVWILVALSVYGYARWGRGE